MSHTYLLELYALIDQRLEKLSAEPDSERQGGEGVSFQQGRSDSLEEFKQFLLEHYNAKLPRRIRNNYTG